jgi:hypothetical protein
MQNNIDMIQPGDDNFDDLGLEGADVYETAPSVSVLEDDFLTELKADYTIRKHRAFDYAASIIQNAADDFKQNARNKENYEYILRTDTYQYKFEFPDIAVDRCIRNGRQTDEFKACRKTLESYFNPRWIYIQADVNYIDRKVVLTARLMWRGDADKCAK